MMPESDPAPRTPITRRLITRRRVLKGLAGGVLAGSGLLGYAVGIEPHWYEVVERPLAFAGLPEALAGKRMVQISDLHSGKTDVDYLANVFDYVSRVIRPDLAMLTGDFVDHGTPQAHRDLPKILGNLRPPPLGAFACLGNHDYSKGWNQLKVADRVAGHLSDAGIRVLRNEVTDVAGLTVLGIDDFWSPRYDPQKVTAGLNLSADALCLCHNPDAQDRYADFANFHGWTLAGHTHGGQCKPPFLPPPQLPVWNRRYVAGEYTITPQRRLYINRGIGHTLRARFNCRPEVTVFTLQRA